jgi:hypothetical protein
MAQIVDDWFARYDNPQKPLVLAVRKAILEADRRLDETIKWSTPTFVYKGNLASFNPKSKAHVSLLVHTGGQISGDFPSLEGTGPIARVMKFNSADDLKAKLPELKRLAKAWCDQRDAGAAKGTA